MKREISSTTTLVEGRDLLTHEEAWKILAGGVDALKNPGRDRLGLRRLLIFERAENEGEAFLRES